MPVPADDAGRRDDRSVFVTGKPRRDVAGTPFAPPDDRRRSIWIENPRFEFLVRSASSSFLVDRPSAVENSMVRPFAIAFVAGILLAVPQVSADHHGNDAEIMKRLIGRWEIDEGVNQGRELEDDQVDGHYVMITAEEIVTYDADQNETYRAKYRLNTKTDPVQIDMVANMNGREVMAKGIVQFEWLDLDGEDEFKLCYSLKPGERPSEFESPEGSQIMLFELEQEDDDDDDD